MRTFTLFFAIFSVASAFRVSLTPKISNRLAPFRMSDESPKYDIVPLDKSNIESAAAVTGGIVGLVILGPVGGLVLAALANFVSKKDNDAGEALRGFGKTVIESVNFLKKVNSKYSLTDKVTETVSIAASNLATESEAAASVKKTVDSTISKVKELNEEFDLVSKGKEVIGLAGTLSDAALEKVDELNKKVCMCVCVECLLIKYKSSSCI